MTLSGFCVVWHDMAFLFFFSGDCDIVAQSYSHGRRDDESYYKYDEGSFDRELLICMHILDELCVFA